MVRTLSLVCPFLPGRSDPPYFRPSVVQGTARVHWFVMHNEMTVTRNKGPDLLLKLGPARPQHCLGPPRLHHPISEAAFRRCAKDQSIMTYSLINDIHHLTSLLADAFIYNKIISYRGCHMLCFVFKRLYHCRRSDGKPWP